MELGGRTLVVFAITILALYEQESQAAEGQKEKLPFPVMFLILSQPSHYDELVANEAKEFIINQAESLNWENPVVYLSHQEWPDVIGAWTIFPLLDRIVERLHHHYWLCISEDVTRIDIQKLAAVLQRFNKSEDYFLGHALRDREATIIHHFAFFENPISFAYPDFASGCLFSLSLLKNSWSYGQLHQNTKGMDEFMQDLHTKGRTPAASYCIS